MWPVNMVNQSPGFSSSHQQVKVFYIYRMDWRNIGIRDSQRMNPNDSGDYSMRFAFVKYDNY